jgi:hypothetical protein
MSSQNDKIKEYRSIDFEGDIRGQGVVYDPITGAQLPETYSARPGNRKRVLPGLIRRPGDDYDPWAV